LAKDDPKPGPTPGMKIKKFETNIFNFSLGGRKNLERKEKENRHGGKQTNGVISGASI